MKRQNQTRAMIGSQPTYQAIATRKNGTQEEILLTVPVGPIKYLRLPPAGANCPICGLSRSYLNLLVLGDDPPVRSFVLKKRDDCKTGVRLVDADSLFRYIEQHPAPTSFDSGRTDENIPTA
jgi:hypothetical protein